MKRRRLGVFFGIFSTYANLNSGLAEPIAKVHLIFEIVLI